MTVTQYGFHETLVNRYQSTLNGGITAGATTITVTSDTGLPAQGFFRVLIDNEIIICSGTSSNVLAVVARGAEGTTAVSHLTGATIQCVITNQALQEYLLRGSYNSAAYTQETSFDDSQGWPVPVNRSTDASRGNLNAASFTWQNQGTATIADSGGGFVLTIPDEANFALRGLTIATPSTPYIFTARFNGFTAPGEPIGSTSSHAGLWIRDSGGQLTTLSFRPGDRLAMWNWTDWNTFSAAVGTNLDFHEPNHIWLRLEDDGTDHKGFFSIDGSNWTPDDSTWWQQGRTAHLTAGGNGIGFYLNSGTNSGNTTTGPATCTVVVDCFAIEEL